MREEFAPFVGFGHVVDELSAKGFVLASLVLAVENAVLVFLHAVAAEKVFGVVAVVAVVEECAADAGVAADHEFCFVGCVGFVVAFDAPCGFVCVVTVLGAVNVVAIFYVFAVNGVVALLGVFAICDVVARAVFGFCDERGFVCRFVFV